LGDLPPFVGAYEHLSRQFQRYVIDLSRMMTILDVAELTGLSWDTVKDLVKKRLAKDYAHIRLKDLRRLKPQPAGPLDPPYPAPTGTDVMTITDLPKDLFTSP
jgi:hypothetical protein